MGDLTTSLDQVRIVLVEPSGPLNVGSIARVMKNMGLSQLVLVNPQCDRLGIEARQMAVHAAEILETAQEVETLPAALQGCQRCIATTGRSHTTLNIPLEQPRAALPWLLNNISNESSTKSSGISALIFGREDHGLTNEELNYAQRLVLIPANPDYVSLNLAQAVAICCYELYVHETTKAQSPQEDFLIPICSSPALADLATFDALEGYYQHLETLLLRIGYLYPHTAASRMEKLRRLFSRSHLSNTELAMLRGMLSQMEWALAQDQSS